MIDKITAKIRRYPFQTGIAVGVLACLLLFGLVSLFQDHGRTLSGNSEIIQQDYLRMTINEYSQNGDELLALWRYEHLGRKAADTLKLMKADTSVQPYDLVTFADAIGKTNVISPSTGAAERQGTPVNPHKGLSNVGKILLIIVGLGVVAAGGLYLASLIQTKRKQQRRAEVNQQRYEDEPINMITPEKARAAASDSPDTLFDLDSLFPQGGEAVPETSGQSDREDDSSESVKPDNTADIADLADKNESAEDPMDKLNEIFNSETDENQDADPEQKLTETNEEINNTGFIQDHTGARDEDDGNDGEPVNEVSERTEAVSENVSQPNVTVYNITEYEVTDDGNEDIDGNIDLEPDQSKQSVEANDIDIDRSEKTEIGSAADSQVVEEPEENSDAEKPLVETDIEADSEGEDELLKMIRGSKTNSDEIIGKSVTASIEGIETADVPSNEVLPETPDPEDVSASEEPAAEPQQDAESHTSENDILIHYQSVYRIGNDMYDEVFSIDQGDTFRGECGISIGETLNNTEPKAVTAFEVWLFDKDDIHTATWYLMSDFALSNEGISHRLEQRGKCDRIRKGDLYTLETETLIVEIKVMELEYGNEMEEKNSYFTNVMFDVIAKQKNHDL